MGYHVKCFAAVLFLLFMVSTAAGEVQYSVDASEEKVDMNISLQMDCSSTSCPGLEWRIPEGSEVVTVTDREGEVDYSVEERIVKIQGERLTSKDYRTLKIQLELGDASEEVYQGLHKIDISLASFSGEKTTGFVNVKNLISGRSSFGFQSSFTDSQLRFSGVGPANLRVNFGDGHTTEYYEFFGSRPSSKEEVYEIALGTLGIIPEFDRLPVAVMPDSVYTDEVNSWSAGEYMSGSIRVRQNADERFNIVLAHETSHGLNDRQLKWDRTRSSYFDEGTSEYVEFLVQKKLGSEDRSVRPPAELFGDEKRWDPDPTDRSYSLIPPEGDRERLWNYYQEDRDFMKTWSPESAETRSFGYAYSELVVRNYVRKGGSISDIYQDMEFEQQVEDSDQKWSFYSGYLEMEPCNYDSRERFDQCLEAINSYEYPIYRGKPTGERQQLDIDQLEVPEKKQKGNSTGIGAGEEVDVVGFFSGFLEYLGSLFSSLLSSL